MVFNRVDAARFALARAVDTRRSANKSLFEPLCVYDIVEDSLEARFVDIPSIEGLYVRTPGPVILVNSQRPKGRQSFSFAHELGHHIFQHGTRVDEVIEAGCRKELDEQEFMADAFAGFLLMPKLAVMAALKARRLEVRSLRSLDVFMLASLFGVTCGAFITHLEYSLKMISREHSERLRSISPKAMRNEICEGHSCGDLVIADTQWSGRPIDLAVDDFVLLPTGSQVDGKKLRHRKSVAGGDLYEALTPGRERVVKENWSSFVRINKRDFTGIVKYRHLEEAE